MLHAMIMAGGGGTRFWPRSRAARPKQFLTFQGERSLLQGTFDRIEAQVPPERRWILTGATHRSEALAQCPELSPEHVIGEPMGRDTAACIALGAALAAKVDADATLLIMPADHLIEPVREFSRAVQAVEQVVAEHPHALITFGIPPTYPATGFGYIRRGEALGTRMSVPAYRVGQFREKPDHATAEKFVASGDYYWNSGIFAWKASTILHEIHTHKPNIRAAVGRIADAWGTPAQASVFQAEYAAIEKISIDFAVMEQAHEVLVLQAPFQWDDVGSWLALERRNPQDAAGNTVTANHLGIDTTNCVIAGDSGHLIATIGLDDLIIIQSGDATLIAPRAREADVKAVVERLKKSPGGERYL